MTDYRLITSPIESLPGTIEFPLSLMLPDVVAYQQAGKAADGLGAWEKILIILPIQARLTGKWNIQGLPEKPTPETFPFTPAGPPTALLAWLHGEFLHLIVGEQQIPNG